jgi:hypothetical protein
MDATMSEQIAVTAWELEAERRREVAGQGATRLAVSLDREVGWAAPPVADRRGPATAWIWGALRGRSARVAGAMTAPATRSR